MATYYDINNTLTQPGAIVYLGEQNLNVSSALLPVYVNHDTAIGWWASPATVSMTAPIESIPLSAINNDSFNISPSVFVNYPGDWYGVLPTGYGDLNGGILFDVQDPNIALDIWDINTSKPVTSGWAIQGDYLTFRITTDLQSALDPTHRVQDIVPNAAQAGNIDIIVRNFKGNTDTSLFNGNGLSSSGITEQNVTLPLWFWGTMGGNTPTSANVNFAWDTGAIDSGGNLEYLGGVYTVVARSRLNGMVDNYLNGGPTFNGETVSLPATVLISPLLPIITKISPATGPDTGHTRVIITGANLDGATSVSFGTLPAISFTVDNNSRITAISPAGVPRTVNVTVVTIPYISSAQSQGDEFTYVTPTANPEFPTPVIPAIIIVGLAGISQVMRRTKEN